MTDYATLHTLWTTLQTNYGWTLFADATTAATFVQRVQTSWHAYLSDQPQHPDAYRFSITTWMIRCYHRELVHAVRQGTTADPQARERANRAANDLWALAHQLCQRLCDPAVRDDIAQQVLLLMIEHPTTLTDPADLYRWMRNTILNLRRQRPFRPASQPLPAEFLPTTLDPPAPPDDELFDHLRRVLSPVQFAIVALCITDDLKTGAIARRLGMAAGNVSVEKHRALDKLRHDPTIRDLINHADDSTEAHHDQAR